MGSAGAAISSARLQPGWDLIATGVTESTSRWHQDYRGAVLFHGQHEFALATTGLDALVSTRGVGQ